MGRSFTPKEIVNVPSQKAQAFGCAARARSPPQWRLWNSAASLNVGSPDDRLVSQAVLNRAASWYGGAPLLFPGMGHDLMLDARWAEPIDAILDWLEKE